MKSELKFKHILRVSIQLATIPSSVEPGVVFCVKSL